MLAGVSGGKPVGDSDGKTGLWDKFYQVGQWCEFVRNQYNVYTFVGCRYGGIGGVWRGGEFLLRQRLEWNNAVGDMLDNLDMLERDGIDRGNRVYRQCGVLLCCSNREMRG